MDCVGYGGAGAVTAIIATDLGASVIIIEKLPADLPNEIRHTPNTRCSHAFVVCPTDEKKASDYAVEGKPQPPQQQSTEGQRNSHGECGPEDNPNSRHELRHDCEYNRRSSACTPPRSARRPGSIAISGRNMP